MRGSRVMGQQGVKGGETAVSLYCMKEKMEKIKQRKYLSIYLLGVFGFSSQARSCILFNSVLD